MSQAPEFAEQYTVMERVRFFVIYIIIGSAVVTLSNLYFFPWLKEFSSTAQCQTILGIDGLAVLWYGLFVGMPLSFAALAGGVFGYRGYKILRDRQAPPIHEKVYRPTRIIRGTKAEISGCLHFLPFSLFLGLSIWGIPQASSMLSRSMSHPVNCTVNSSVK